MDLDYEESKIDAVHSLRKVEKFIPLLPMITEYSTQMFTFPGILIVLSFALVPLAVSDEKGAAVDGGVQGELYVRRRRTELIRSFHPSYAGVRPVVYVGADGYSVQGDFVLDQFEWGAD